MQGCLLTQKNVDNMLRVIGKALTRFEDKVAQALMEVVESDTYQVRTEPSFDRFINKYQYISTHA